MNPPAPQPSRGFTRLAWTDNSGLLGGETSEVANDYPLPVRLYGALGQPIDTSQPAPPTVGVLLPAGTILENGPSGGAITLPGGTGQAFTNPGFRGITFFLNVTAHAGTNPTLGLQLAMVDPTSRVALATAAPTSGITTTNQLYVCQVYPGITAANMTTTTMGVINAGLPALWSLILTIGGTALPNYILSVSYAYVP